MVSPVIASMRIPEVVYPPVPGESHRYYGNIHLKQLRLPSNSFNQNLRGTTSYPRYSEDGSIEGDLDIHEAAAAGNFTRVKELLAPRGSESGETTSAFLLANEASTSSGMTPLHYAASRGHYEIVKWLIDYAGAIVDLEDQTGETALLKASYNGHSSVVAYLLQKQANVTQRDNDGWTALHNASALGFLQIVKYFIEHTEADADVKSNKGHTPLMNAASKGNIEIVEYLLNRGYANPFVKNNFGEIAYDVAATSQEVYCCELLEKAERDWWKGKRPLPQPTSFKELVDLPNADQPYDVYNFHITVPVILHENQRSSSATFGLPLRGPPKYSPSNLLKSDVRGPWSLPDGKPSSKDDVRLPVGPTSSSVSIVSNVTSSKSQKRWFWVTDWQVDMTHPRVDSQGWQYARSFDESERNWYPSQQSNNGSWVRRRRWVRVMKRRMDLPDDGSVLQLVQDNNGQRDGPDYVERAEAIIKKVQDNKSFSEADQLGQYKEAIDILLSGSRVDTNATRKQEANSLASSFMTHAEHLDNRLKGIGMDTESFKEIPMTPTLQRNTSPSQFKFESPANRPRSVTPTITNLNNPSTISLKSFETMDSPWNDTVQSNDAVGNSSPVLNDSNMVSPTRVHPQIGVNMTNVQANDLSSFGKWENDDEVQECRSCRKKFGLWIRRHHCRRCGRVVCDKCSTARVDLPPEQVITDPSQSGETNQSQFHRVCDQCYTSLGLTARPRPSSYTSFTSTTVVSGSSSTNHRRRLSNNSTMTECPVCSLTLSKIGNPEEHVKNCFENKNGSNVVGYKYVVYKLPQNNPLVGQECPICFEEFLSGETVTRMNCLCSYHYHCIHDWFAKGGECPIHFL